MYYFIYDSVAQSQENAKELAKIENRLLDFGIKDKIVKSSPLKPVRDAVAEAYKQKYNTIITVGEDNLFLAAAEFLVGYPIALGTIPLGKRTRVASLLGMPHSDAACEIISARKITETPVGKVDEHFFLSTCVLRGVNTMRMNDSYTLEIKNQSTVVVTNYQSIYTGVDSTKRGLLSIAVQQPKNGFFSKIREKKSILFAKSITISSSKNLEASIDGQPPITTCSTISVHNKNLVCIVGKTSSLG